MYPKKRYSSYFCLVIPLFWTLCSTQSTQFCSNAKTGGLVTTTETEIDSPVNYVYWKPPDYNVLFVRTSKNTVYRSSDGGRVWASQLPFMASALDNPSGVQKIYPTADSSVFFFLGFNGKLWITKDNGTTYTKIQGNNLNFDELSPHPARAAWLLGTDYTPACYSSNTSITPPCYKRLWLSLDYGSSWNLIGTYIYSYSWTSAGLNGVPEKTIWMLDWPDKTGAQYAYRFRLIKKTSNLQLRHSVDFFQSVINHGLTNSIFFLYQNDNIYIARSLNKTLGLYVSEDYGRTFNKAQFPLTGGFSETQYSILDDTSEGKVFLAVTLGNPNWGNVYSSDSLGSTFDLSLKFVKKDSSGRAQFMKVKSVEGVYIANEVQNVHGLNNGAGPKTVISYDLGGEWNFLPLPLNNSDQPIPCNDQGCTLNLNSYPKRDDLQNFFYQPGPILSRKEAVGLVIATGNTGALLNTNTLDFSTIHTYLTRDAGWTWYDIGAGTNIYEFADHGALIVMANNVQPVKSFTYTWDEGLTFDNCTFTNNTNGVRIRNILVEPPLKAEEFLMHGTRINSSSTTVGVLIHIDFGNFHQRECIYPQDYELFSPYDNKDASQIHCELGVTTQYTRRKRDSACFNPDEYERAVQVSTCPCTLEDYECDICYERQGTVCSRVPECIPPDPVCENGVYYVTRGYRLIAGNQCNMSAPHAVNFLPVKAQCQSESSSSGDGNSGPSAGIIVLIVFLVMAVLFAIGAGLAYMRKKGLNPNVIRNKILNRQMEEESTAFDDDLLEAKEADELDDATLSQKFENKESAPENLI